MNAPRTVIWIHNDGKKYRVMLNPDGSAYHVQIETYPRGKCTTLRAVKHPKTIARVLETRGTSERIAEACQL